MRIRDIGFTQLLQMIDDLDSMDDFKYVFDNLKQIYGIHNIAYHAFDLSYGLDLDPILIITYEQEWVKRYIEKGYFKIDPVIDAGRRRFLPIDWATLGQESRAASLFFKEADHYDVGRQGMTFPVCKPFGGRALFSVTSNANAKDWETKRAAHLGEFQLIANYIHDKATQLSGLDAPNRLARPLSKRERQCLHAVSHGLTAKQIAADLEISNTAVHLYLSSAKKKLSCDNISQAAVCAAQLGIILDILEVPERTFSII